MAETEYEARARAIKAGKIALVLDRHHATAADARALPPTGRRMAEELAGVRESSDATWEAVFANLEQRARWHTADPFDVFPKVDA